MPERKPRRKQLWLDDASFPAHPLAVGPRFNAASGVTQSSRNSKARAIIESSGVTALIQATACSCVATVRPHGQAFTAALRNLRALIPASYYFKMPSFRASFDRFRPSTWPPSWAPNAPKPPPGPKTILPSGIGRFNRTGEPHAGTGWVHALSIHGTGRASIWASVLLLLLHPLSSPARMLSTIQFRRVCSIIIPPAFAAISKAR